MSINLKRKNNDKKVLKDAVDVDFNNVNEVYDLLVQYLGEEELLRAIKEALNVEALIDNLEWIAKNIGVEFEFEDGSEEINIGNVQEVYTTLLEGIGPVELLDSLVQSIGTDDLVGILDFIARTYDIEFEYIDELL